MTGRSKLDLVKDKLLELVAAGNYAEVAARAVGIHPSTLYDWLATGRDGKQKRYVDFAEAFEAARATAEARMVTTIQVSAKKDWRAAAWYLERSQPARWGRRIMVEGAPDGEPVRVEHSGEVRPGDLDDAERTRQVLAAMAEAGILPEGLTLAVDAAPDDTVGEPDTV